VADRFTAIVCDRAEVAGLTVSDELRDSLAAYLLLLSRWTRKINLTSFDLETPTDAAIDRLVIEPLVAAKLVLPTDRFSIDIGSGGGSPAIPMRLAQPNLETVLVEVRERKAAFLREVTRTLRLGNVHVEAQTFETFAAQSQWHGRADLVTMRAVRSEAAIWRDARSVVKNSGRVLWFTGIGETTKNIGKFVLDQQIDPVAILRPI